MFHGTGTSDGSYQTPEGLMYIEDMEIIKNSCVWVPKETIDEIMAQGIIV